MGGAATRQPPTVSVIINNYNYGRFLGEAIDSALGQTHPQLEVIVVDDGSKDNSREIIASYGDRVIPVLKENGGQASAINAGFAISSGDIVFFLDSDDVLLPIAAETVVGSWRNPAPRIQFPLEVIDPAGNTLGRVMGGSAVPSSLLGPFGVGSPTSGNVFSRKLLESIMPIPEERWKIRADAYLVAASSLFGGVTRLQQLLAKYRVHGENRVECAKNDLKELRQRISRHFLLHGELVRLGNGKIGPLKSWLGAYPQHWIDRITSLREGPSDHPWPDTLPSLALSAISATWHHPYWNFRRKLAYTAFVIGYSLSPGAIRRALKRAEAGAHAHPPALVLGSEPTASRGSR